MPDVLDLYDRLDVTGRRYTVAFYARGKRRWVSFPGSHSAAEAALLAARLRRRYRVTVTVRHAVEPTN